MGPFLPAALVLVVGCSGYGVRVRSLPQDPGWRLVSRPAPLPRGRVTADCGPEALSAVLRYYGKPADVDEITRRIYRKELKGTLSTALPPLAREKGLAIALVRGTFPRLKEAIDKDVPPIIMVRVRPELYHFFVVVGYNDPRSEIVCEDYDGGKVLISYEQMEEGWQASDYYYLELSAADASSDVAVAHDRESKGLTKEALEYYRRALAADPGYVEALVGLGNCLYATGDRAGAREAYERALKLAPDDPKLCNNLADLYVALGVRADEAEKLAGSAVEGLEKRRKSLQAELMEAHEALRPQIKQELDDTTLDLASAFGTLGQARAANGRFEVAIGAWEASLALIPLTEFDWRARRMMEIAGAYEKLRMPHKARETYTRALETAKDPALKAKIEERLR